MTSTKFTISFPEDLHRAAREAAELAGLSLSAWLADAAAHRVRQHFLRAAIEDYEAEHGKIIEEELQRVRRVLWGEP